MTLFYCIQVEKKCGIRKSYGDKYIFLEILKFDIFQCLYSQNNRKRKIFQFPSFETLFNEYHWQNDILYWM